MSYRFDSINGETTIPALADAIDFRRRVRALLDTDGPRFRKLWNYHRNPMLPALRDCADAGSNRPYRQAQEWGLPSRITGVTAGTEINTTQAIDGIARKEVVVENDIGWRIDTLVDYLFGKSPTITSAAADLTRRDGIETLLRAVVSHNGGVTFLQQLALMGAVYGFVDVLVKLDRSAASHLLNDLRESNPDGAGPSARADESGDPPDSPPAEPALSEDVSPAPKPGIDAPRTNRVLERIARCIRLEIVEPARALPLLDPNDFRTVQAYAQVYSVARVAAKGAPKRLDRGWIERIFPRFVSTDRTEDEVEVVEILTPTRWQRYEDETLVAEGENSLGELPLVHIQNTAVPFEYAGAGDVEALVPLQDELNTRLSDRGHRIAMQSFKMYLGKGIENFGELPVAPGRMWMTENENAQIVEFGGDNGAPGEDAHIREIREAMDKTSGVTPIAAGAIRGRIGRLTSAAALRVTLLALLAKTERKRTLYGEGLQRMCSLALAWLDRAGLFKTSEDERHVELSWPSILPIDDTEKLADAEAKLRLGVPRDAVLRELGYTAPTTA